MSLGLAAGAMLAEACVLVPFWRAEKPASFLEWYSGNASRLLNFFGPLEGASGLLVVAAMVLAWLGLLPGRFLFSVSAGLTVAVLLSYPVYFKAVNESFADGSIPLDHVPDALGRWAAWHWLRTSAGIAAFLLAIGALVQR